MYKELKNHWLWDWYPLYASQYPPPGCATRLRTYTAKKREKSLVPLLGIQCVFHQKKKKKVLVNRFVKIELILHIQYIIN